MYFNDMECCGVKELTNIGDYDEPKAVMLGVCEQLREEPEYTWGSPYRPRKTTLMKPSAQYVFTAVEDWKEINCTDPDCDGDCGADETPDNTTKVYGKLFAAYIKENQLGHVTRSRLGYNPNYKTHKIRTYVWTPNEKNLKEWWEENRPKRKTAETT